MFCKESLIQSIRFRPDGNRVIGRLFWDYVIHRETNTEEKALAESLDKKYGEGSLDLESGEFTPKN